MQKMSKLRDDESPLPPCLPCIPSFKIARGRVFTDKDYQPFFTASQVKKQEMLVEIERLARQADAAKFIIEARMQLWDVWTGKERVDIESDEWVKEVEQKASNSLF